jgi:ketosteroid isomerase-like protein
MRAMLLGFAMLAALAAAPASAMDQNDVKARVQAFIDAFNKGDMDQVKAICADETSIIDEFPPYEWHGSGACLKWGADYGTDAQRNGITDGKVKLGKFRRHDVSGDRAYLVANATYTFKRKGKAVAEKNATLAIALQKSTPGWRIIAWSWGRP